MGDRVTVMDPASLIVLAESWAEAAGWSLQFPEWTWTQKLTDAGDLERGLIRAAMELFRTVKADTGESHAELMRYLQAQPVDQDAEGP